MPKRALVGWRFAGIPFLAFTYSPMPFRRAACVHEITSWDTSQCFHICQKKITDLVEIGRTNTFPHDIPVGSNTANFFVVKDLKKESVKNHWRTWRDSFSVTPWSPSAEHEPPSPWLKILDIAINTISHPYCHVKWSPYMYLSHCLDVDEMVSSPLGRIPKRQKCKGQGIWRIMFTYMGEISQGVQSMEMMSYF